MENGKKGFSKKQKKSLLKTFLIAAAITLVICCGVLGAGVAVYNSTFKAESTSQVVDLELTEEEVKFEEEKEVHSEINKTVAVFGVDEDEVRTDVIFVVNFNSETGKAKVLSVPRDTKVQWTDKQNRALQQLTGYTRSVSKLNEMSAYGQINKNIGNIKDFTIDELENILKVKIDNYVVINLDAFRAIVDAIDGVDVDVPTDMDYDDSHQDLHIHLKAGYQHLDSHDAEGLVRFRGYLEGDAHRVEVQQIFLKEVARKVLSPEMRLKLPDIARRMMGYIKTDIGLGEILDYLKLLDEFDLNDLKFYIAPGVGRYEGNVSYYFIDEEKLEDMIREVFYSTEEQSNESETDPNTDETDKEEIVVDKSVAIEIYNAAGTKGLATKYKDKMIADGYNVVKFDNYKEVGLEDSTIYAKDKKKAMQFQSYVEGAKIIEDSSIDTDIMIVLGKDAIDQ